MKLHITWEQVEAWRDRVHRRSPRRAIATKAQALRFVNDVGFCFAFKSEHSELPCMWHAATGSRDPVMPEHSHMDPHISFVWEMKDVLPAERLIYYGKLLKHRPTMVSVDFLPYFYVLSGRTGQRREFDREYIRGKLSRTAREILETLDENAPQPTKGLKLAVGLDRKQDRAEFDEAIAELQEKMYIAKSSEQQDPFSFVWAPLELSFPKQVRKARRISPDEARLRILERYFRNQMCASFSQIRRLFRWEKQDIYRAVGQLVQMSFITGNVTISGKPEKYFCLTQRRP